MGFFTKTVIKEVVKEVIPEGYIKVSEVRDLEKKPYTEDEILDMFVSVMGKIYGDKVDKKQEREIFDKIMEVEGVNDYFRDTLGADIQRYYVASTREEQLQVRGAFSRTLYLKGLLKKQTKKNPLNVTRYAR